MTVGPDAPPADPGMPDGRPAPPRETPPDQAARAGEPQPGTVWPDHLPVPPGPGVRPPFVAPPTDGARRRRGLAVALSIVAVVVCCAGALFGVGGFAVLGQRAVAEQATRTVEDFYDGITTRDFPQAYAQLCDRLRERSTIREFEEEVTGAPTITSYRVGELETVSQLSIPVELTVEDAGTRSVRVQLAQDMTSGEFRVCGSWV